MKLVVFLTVKLVTMRFHPSLLPADAVHWKGPNLWKPLVYLRTVNGWLLDIQHLPNPLQQPQACHWLKMRIDSSISGSSSRKSGDFTNGTAIPIGSKVNFGGGYNHNALKGTKSEPMYDSQILLLLMRMTLNNLIGNLLSGNKRLSRTRNSTAKVGDTENNPNFCDFLSSRMFNGWA